MSKDQAVSIEDLIYKWDSYLRMDITPSERYAHDERMGHFDYLMRMLRGAKFDMYDVKGYKNKIVDYLITDEGKKGKGKHKDWYKWVKSDFDAAVAMYYVDVDVEGIEPLEHDVPQKVVINNKTNPFRQEDNEDIMKWVNSKYSNITQLMIDDAHTAGSELNIEFIVDICA